MTAKEFLIERLEGLFASFQDIQIRYEYRKSTHSHLIEVLPLSLFEESDAYIDAEDNLEKKFEESFPGENIVFISTDSISEIYNSDLELGHDSFNFRFEDIFCEIEFAGINDTIEPKFENQYALAA